MIYLSLPLLILSILCTTTAASPVVSNDSSNEIDFQGLEYLCNHFYKDEFVISAQVQESGCRLECVILQSTRSYGSSHFDTSVAKVQNINEGLTCNPEIVSHLFSPYADFHFDCKYRTHLSVLMALASNHPKQERLRSGSTTQLCPPKTRRLTALNLTPMSKCIWTKSIWWKRKPWKTTTNPFGDKCSSLPSWLRTLRSLSSWWTGTTTGRRCYWQFRRQSTWSWPLIRMQQSFVRPKDRPIISVIPSHGFLDS